jgi:hypothetical protein
MADEDNQEKTDTGGEPQEFPSATEIMDGFSGPKGEDAESGEAKDRKEPEPPDEDTPGTVESSPPPKTKPGGGADAGRRARVRRKSRPILPSIPGQRGASGAHRPASPNVNDSPLIREGNMIVGRAGRLGRSDLWWTFTFEADREVLREPPMKLLPNRWLESMESDSEGATLSVVFVVTGEIMEYHDENYMIVRAARIKRDLGNLR